MVVFAIRSRPLFYPQQALIMAKLKYDREERALFSGRALQAFSVIVVLALLLIARFFYLQYFEFDTYRAKSENNRIKLIPIPPQRGLIFDRHGVLLAENRSAFRLEISPEEVPSFAKKKAQIWAELARLTPLDDELKEDFERAFLQRKKFQAVLIKQRLNEEDVARISLALYRLPGVHIQPYLTRYYPEGAATAHIVGFVGRLDEDDLAKVDSNNYLGTDYIGKMGIESRYEVLLHGKVGFKQVEVNAAGREVRVIKITQPEPGKNVYLSLDIALQKAAIAAYGDQIGAAVAIDPGNGEVLAMVSVPSFDPNLFVGGISRANYKILMEDRLRPTFDRALSGAYPPGSTIKPFMGIAGLELGLRTPSSTVVSRGIFFLPGARQGFRDWRPGGHGVINLHEAIAQSVNTYFYQLAFDMGIDRMHDYLGRFGLGQLSGIDLYGESSALVPNKAWKLRVRKQQWFPGETVVCGIGQGQMSTTPLQLAHAAATLAAHGVKRTPRLLMATQVGAGQPIVKLAPSPARASFITNSDNWYTVRDAMIAVLHGPTGTARGATRGMQYQIAGKTGTAQQVGANAPRDASGKIDARFKNQALFVGFAPANAPVLSVGLIVEQGGSGAHAAAPVGRAIFDAYLSLQARNAVAPNAPVSTATPMLAPAADQPPVIAPLTSPLISPGSLAPDADDEQHIDELEVPESELQAPTSLPANPPEPATLAAPNAAPPQ
jgi:penicillin-binding protein 2